MKMTIVAGRLGRPGGLIDADMFSSFGTDALRATDELVIDFGARVVPRIRRY